MEGEKFDEAAVKTAFGEEFDQVRNAFVDGLVGTSVIWKTLARYPARTPG